MSFCLKCPCGALVWAKGREEIGDSVHIYEDQKLEWDIEQSTDANCEHDEWEIIDSEYDDSRYD